MRADFSTRRRVGSPRLRDALLLTVGVAALIWAAVTALAARSELERARLALQELRESAPAEERRLHELEGARRDRNDALANQALQTLTSPPARILSDIETALPSGARLEGLTLTYGQEAVELEIQLLAHTPETYDEFVARVEGSRCFGRLAFGSESRSGEMKVSLRADYRAKGGS
jgi:Tfp pilus assembly protein PilN